VVIGAGSHNESSQQERWDSHVSHDALRFRE
jgi:hypothetical protein